MTTETEREDRVRRCAEDLAAVYTVTVDEAMEIIGRVGQAFEDEPDTLTAVNGHGQTIATTVVKRPKWTCKTCGYDRWVQVSYTGPVTLGGTALAECVRCGTAHDLPTGEA